MPESRASRLAVPAALLLLAAGVACMALYAAHDVFDADELQHAHLAWLVAGGKLLYVEVWDNHGPLFTLANAALLALTDAPPGLELLYACRAGALAAAAGILACTYGIARRLAMSPASALAAVAITASLLFVQDKAAECRPDGWQNLFWLGGLLVLLGPRRGAGRPLAAGALFGLAVLLNVKAALGPAIVAATLAAGARAFGLAPRALLAELGALLAGGLAVYLPVVAYFAAQGAAFALHDYSLLWNLLYVGLAQDGAIASANVANLVERQLPFLVAVAVGLVAWLADLRAPDGRLARPAAWLVLAAAAGTGASLALDFYTQFFLVFLPLWSIVAAFGIFRCGEWLAASAGNWGRAATAVLVAVAAGALVAAAARYVPLKDRPVLVFQKAFANLMLQTTPRTEPIGVIWDVCGGFMFNEPLQFYWGAEPAIGATALRHGGRDPFAEDFVAALEKGPVRFVVGRDDGLVLGLPEATQRYLREHYRYANCLWRRRDAPGPGDAS